MIRYRIKESIENRGFESYELILTELGMTKPSELYASGLYEISDGKTKEWTEKLKDTLAVDDINIPEIGYLQMQLLGISGSFHLVITRKEILWYHSKNKKEEPINPVGLTRDEQNNENFVKIKEKLHKFLDNAAL